MPCLKYITSLFILCIFYVQHSMAQVADSIAIKNLQQENEARKQQVQQLNKEVTELKAALKKQQQQGFDKFMLSSNFLDAAKKTVCHCTGKC
jgi:cell division protein FtsB